MALDKFRRAFRIKGPLTLERAGTKRGSAQIYLTEATVALTKEQSGKLHIATKASATQTFTLPLADEAGMTFTFKCGNGGAAGEIRILPQSADTIQIKATNNAGAEIQTAAGVGVFNTAATNVDGDYLTLVSDGVIGWHTVAQSGIWGQIV